MKHVILFASILVAAYGLTPDQIDAMKGQIMQMGEECQGEAPINGDDIAELMAKKSLSRKEGKCFMFCMHKKIRFQDAAGKLDHSGVSAWLADLKAIDADFSDKMKQVADKCIPTIDDSGDPCETASVTYDCYIRTAKEMGVDMIM